MEDLLDLLPEMRELLIERVEIPIKLPLIIASADSPINGREMLPLGKFLIQPPEDLHNGQSGSSDRVREVAAGGGHGPHDGDAAFSARVADTFGAACSLVELG
jgi:hypothetical protein